MGGFKRCVSIGDRFSGEPKIGFESAITQFVNLSDPAVLFEPIGESQLRSGRHASEYTNIYKKGNAIPIFVYGRLLPSVAL
jgi:hypothetical protein